MNFLTLIVSIAICITSSFAAPNYQEITEYHTNGGYPGMERIMAPIGQFGVPGMAARPFYYNPQPQDLMNIAYRPSEQHRMRRQIMGGGMGGASAGASATASSMGGGMGMGGYPMMPMMGMGFPFMG